MSVRLQEAQQMILVKMDLRKNEEMAHKKLGAGKAFQAKETTGANARRYEGHRESEVARLGMGLWRCLRTISLGTREELGP